jgi:hypothetical protein
LSGTPRAQRPGGNETDAAKGSRIGQDQQEQFSGFAEKLFACPRFCFFLAIPDYILYFWWRMLRVSRKAHCHIVEFRLHD